MIKARSIKETQLVFYDDLSHTIDVRELCKENNVSPGYMKDDYTKFLSRYQKESLLNFAWAAMNREQRKRVGENYMTYITWTQLGWYVHFGRVEWYDSKTGEVKE